MDRKKSFRLDIRLSTNDLLALMRGGAIPRRATVREC
jgi:hypothetical protein